MADRAVFLDRDGTINDEVGYLSGPEQVTLLPGAAGALAQLRKAGFKLVVVTNQSGIARGYFTEEDLRRVNDTLEGLLAGEGVKVDAFYHCPHHPTHGEKLDCSCRKPKTGMVKSAAAKLGVDIRKSYFVGDKATDVELGINAGGKSVLVLTGFGKEEEKLLEAKGIGPYMVFGGLAEAAGWIIKDSRGS